MPVIIPDAEPAVAMTGLLLLHVPPTEMSVSVMDDPMHSVEEPDMVAGGAVTVTVVVVLHPAVLVKVIDAVPGVPPVMIPVAEPITATAGLLLAQEPVVPVVSVPVAPEQTITDPVMEGGRLFTVITLVVMHPVPIE
jgi:hypothetical protein